MKFQVNYEVQCLIQVLKYGEYIQVNIIIKVNSQFIWCEIYNGCEYLVLLSYIFLVNVVMNGGLYM